MYACDVTGLDRTRTRLDIPTNAQPSISPVGVRAHALCGPAEDTSHMRWTDTRRRHHNPSPCPVAGVGAITELGGPEGGWGPPWEAPPS
eukprot:6351692-Prymnesium_polylepis.1